MNDEFYVGYLHPSPPALARHTRRRVVLVFAWIVAVAVMVASSQDPAEPGTFEFGIRRSFEGVLFEYPLPVLRHVEDDGSVRQSLLVGPGKYGLPSYTRGHHGRHVRFEGSRIRSPQGAMIEMNAPETFRVRDDPTGIEADPPVGPVGEVVMTGELVDTKCYFGVMRPAVGKIHRACAVRCLAGGVPPGLRVRDGVGGASVIMLSGDDRSPLRLDPEWAARQVRVEGTLHLHPGYARLTVRRIHLLDDAVP